MRQMFAEGVKITKVKDAQSGATGDVDSDSVDMAGFEGVIFLCSFGTAAADNLLLAEQSSDDGSSDTFAELAGTEVNAGGASDEDQWIEVKHPRERYVRCVAQRGTSSTSGDIWAIQYGARSLPQDNTTTGTIAGQSLHAPAEGTP